MTTQTQYVDDYLIDDTTVTVTVTNGDTTEIYTAPSEQLADYLESQKDGKAES